MAKQPEPRYMGGQAVMEGVMMRGADAWAVAVRTPEDGIEVVVHDAPRWSERYRRIPLVRGITALAESLSLGFRALAWSANRQVPEDEQLPSGAMGWAMGGALVVFTALFILLPALAARGLDRFVDGSGVGFHVAEGTLRLALFVGYIVAISRMADIRRVFEYHGAEHKAIAAYENGTELTPEAAQRFTTQHVRCGTNFLLTVMVVTILVYSLFGRPDWVMLVASRVVLIPVIAGLSFEVIRFAARHMDRRWIRVLVRPGLALQRLTTREPSDDQVEVALAALRAVLTAEQLAEVEARAASGTVVTRPALGTA
ncbi:MAG: DUF1385 domain-containing protein [Acidimicrobiia bacterium]|nr:DUF1385 domain-containing protein [Acidimicrobiia bacterium]